MTIATVEARNEPQTTSLASQTRQARQTKLMMMMQTVGKREGRAVEKRRCREFSASFGAACA